MKGLGKAFIFEGLGLEVFVDAHKPMWCYLLLEYAWRPQANVRLDTWDRSWLNNALRMVVAPRSLTTRRSAPALVVKPYMASRSQH